MANLNRVILAGNLTRDPELSFTPSNIAVCKFGLAVNRTWTDKQTNSRREEVTFVDCTAWTRSAELINQYCRKGKGILIEGRLKYDTWTAPDGQKRSKLSVVVETFQFLGSAPGSGTARGPESGGGSAEPAAEYDAAPSRAPVGPVQESYPPDDVPF